MTHDAPSIGPNSSTAKREWKTVDLPIPAHKRGPAGMLAALMGTPAHPSHPQSGERPGIRVWF